MRVFIIVYSTLHPVCLPYTKNCCLIKIYYVPRTERNMSGDKLLSSSISREYISYYPQNSTSFIMALSLVKRTMRRSLVALILLANSKLFNINYISSIFTFCGMNCYSSLNCNNSSKVRSVQKQVNEIIIKCTNFVASAR